MFSKSEGKKTTNQGHFGRCDYQVMREMNSARGGEDMESRLGKDERQEDPFIIKRRNICNEQRKLKKMLLYTCLLPTDKYKKMGDDKARP
jgi:hypothetical protein